MEHPLYEIQFLYNGPIFKSEFWETMGTDRYFSSKLKCKEKLRELRELFPQKKYRMVKIIKEVIHEHDE